ncbi:MAG: ATP-binding protein, partial [Bacteroidota bacterium]
MPTNIRQNLYLICKEAITNAAKHSNGDRMQIQFKKHGRNGIQLTIHDNGKVVEKAHKTTGLGMSNMTMRAEQIGGKLKVNVANGFLIEVTLA